MSPLARRKTAACFVPASPCAQSPPIAFPRPGPGGAPPSVRASAAESFSAAGPGESTTDLAWDGHAAIFECGDRLAETARFPRETSLGRGDVGMGPHEQKRLA